MSAAAAELHEVERALARMLLGAQDAPLDGVPRARQHAMRRLVHNNLRGLVRRAIPHARRLAGDAAIETLLSRFLDEAPPTTRLVREVPRAFAAFVASLPASACPHESFGELVHWETLELEVLFAPDADPSLHARDTTDAVLTPHPSARLAVYRFDVTSVDDHATRWPAQLAAPRALLCFRVADRVRWRSLSPACATVLVTCAHGAAVTTALATQAGGAADAVRAELRALAREGALMLDEPKRGEPG